ncbi:MAG: hypothetical protein Kapaf2KO_00850 [Candidatus Kapaibacteriales bacterium]
MINNDLEQDRSSRTGQFFLLFVLIVVFAAFSLSAKADDASDRIVNEIQKNVSGLKTFTADIKADINVDYIDIPQKNGKIYYKSPGKTKIEIDGFGMLPKIGSGNFVDQIMNSENITAIYAGEDKVNGKTYELLKVLPQSSSSDIVLSTLWVQKGKGIVDRAETTLKSNGTFMIDFDNERINSVIMPTKIKVIFDVPEFKIPKTMTGAPSSPKEEKKEKNKKEGRSKGSITLTYQNIKVNTSIANSVFD